MREPAKPPPARRHGAWDAPPDALVPAREPPAPEPGPPRRERPRLLAVLAAAAVVLGLGGVLAGLLERPGEGPARAVFRVSGHPTGLVTSAGRVWVAAPGEGMVYVLDAATGAPARTPLRTGGTPARLALAASGVWAGDTSRAAIVALAPAPGAPLRVGPDVADIAVSSGAVWVASSADGTVRAVERDGGRERLRAGTRVVALAADDRRVVALDAGRGALATIDARTRALSGPAIPVGGVPVDVALSGDAAWVADARAGTVRRVDLRTRRPAGAPLAACREPVALAADGDDVYVACRGDRSLVRIDARSGHVVSRIDIGAEPSAVALDPHYAWVSAGESRVVRVAR
jgi:DNA-binding beta-propeller fold protein YncE